MQRQWRLTKRQDFSKIYKYGKSTANQQFVVYYLPNRTIEQFQIGISVSKKLGNAVVRNRIRRLVKEIVRGHADQIISQIDFILIARKPVVHMNYRNMESCILHVLKKASLIRRN